MSGLLGIFGGVSVFNSIFDSHCKLDVTLIMEYKEDYKRNLFMLKMFNFVVCILMAYVIQKWKEICPKLLITKSQSISKFKSTCRL